MFFRISDRYIIRAFLFAFLVCFIALVGLYAIVDTVVNLSNVIDHMTVSAAQKAAAQGLSTVPERTVWSILRQLGEMNLARMPHIFYDLIPLLTLSAAMFTVVRLKRQNEITPLLASGVSIYRVVGPIFFMAVVLAVIQVVDREVIIPKYSQDLYSWDKVRNENLYQFRSQAMMEDSYGNVVFAGKYEIARKIQYGAWITSYWEEAGDVRTPRVTVNAQVAHWRREPDIGWMYSDGMAIEHDRSGNIIRQMPFGESGYFVPLVLADAAPPEAGSTIVSDITPARLESEEVDIFYRPTLYLLEYVQDHGLRADIALDLNKRLAAPLANAILLLLGLPFVLKRDVKNPFLAVLAAVVIAAGYLATGIVTENFALEGRILTPLTGAWAPIIIFGPLGVLLFDAVES